MKYSMYISTDFCGCGHDKDGDQHLVVELDSDNILEEAVEVATGLILGPHYDDEFEFSDYFGDEDSDHHVHRVFSNGGHLITCGEDDSITVVLHPLK